MRIEVWNKPPVRPVVLTYFKAYWFLSLLNRTNFSVNWYSVATNIEVSLVHNIYY